MTQKAQFQLQARYNEWMNQKLYRACEGLPDGLLQQDQGAFFTSVHGTLNHIYAADVFWLRQFAKFPRRFKSLANVSTLPYAASIGDILFTDLKSWQQHRVDLDRCIIKWCEETDNDDYDQVLTYRVFPDRDHQDPLGLLMSHFFNHQTHHRGQITTLLTQSGVDVGSTDMWALMQEG